MLHRRPGRRVPGPRGPRGRRVRRHHSFPGRIAARIGPNGTRIGDLAEQALVTKQTATATVDRLERAGYVRRVPDPTDARARLVVIAERGTRALEVARVAEGEIEAEWVRHLGAPRRQASYETALEQIREIADPYA